MLPDPTKQPPSVNGLGPLESNFLDIGLQLPKQVVPPIGELWKSVIAGSDLAAPSGVEVLRIVSEFNEGCRKAVERAIAASPNFDIESVDPDPQVLSAAEKTTGVLSGANIVARTSIVEGLLQYSLLISVPEFSLGLSVGFLEDRIAESPEVFQYGEVATVHALCPGQGWSHYVQVSPEAVPELLKHLEESFKSRQERQPESDTLVPYSHLLHLLDEGVTQALNTERFRALTGHKEMLAILPFGELATITRVSSPVRNPNGGPDSHLITLTASVPAGFDPETGQPLRAASECQGKLGSRRSRDAPIQMLEREFRFELYFDELRVAHVRLAPTT